MSVTVGRRVKQLVLTGIKKMLSLGYAFVKRLHPGLDQVLARVLEPSILERVLFEQAPVRQSFAMTHDVLRDYPPPKDLEASPPHAFYKLIPWLYRANAFVTAHIAEHAINEGLFLHEQCSKKADGTLVEVGRRVGGSTIVMASALRKGTLHSLDILPLNDDSLRTCLAKIGVADRVNIAVADSTKFRHPAIRQIDLLFLDGNKESDEAIAADLANFTPLMPRGSLLLIHDANELPVQRTVARLVRDGYRLVEQVGLLVCMEKQA